LLQITEVTAHILRKAVLRATNDGWSRCTTYSTILHNHCPRLKSCCQQCQECRHQHHSGSSACMSLQHKTLCLNMFCLAREYRKDCMEKI